MRMLLCFSHFFSSDYLGIIVDNLNALLHPSPIGFLFKPDLTCSYEVVNQILELLSILNPMGQWRTQSQVRFSTEVDYTQLIRSIHHFCDNFEPRLNKTLGLLKNHDFDWLLVCWEIFFPTSSIPFLTENSNFHPLRKYHYFIPLLQRTFFFSSSNL